MEKTADPSAITPTASVIMIKYHHESFAFDHAHFVAWAIEHPHYSLMDYISELPSSGYPEILTIESRPHGGE